MKGNFSVGEYRAFFEAIKEWTIKSHRNQKTTSEVIINMLLSPFIGEIVAFALNQKTKVKLLAKEFPIDVIFKNNSLLQYGSVDYILYAKDELFLTELKTSNNSVDGKQILNMLYTCQKGVEEIFKPLQTIIKNRIEKKNHEVPTNKYLYTLALLSKILNLKNIDIEDLSYKTRKEKRHLTANKIIENARNKIKAKTIKIIYISLCKINCDEIIKATKISLNMAKKENKFLLKEYKNNLDSIAENFLLKPIIIEDIVKNEDFKMPKQKQFAWNLVKDILNELLENPDDWFKNMKI